MWRNVLASGLFEALNLFGKFLLLVLISRMLSPEDLGLFQIFRADLSIGMLLIGLEYSGFTTREILRRPASDAPSLVRNQLAVHLATYMVLLPALLTLFLLQDDRLAPLGGLLAMLLVVDHLGQELCRLLVTLRRPVAASALTFLRHAAWIYLLAAMVLTRRMPLDVRRICIWWLAGEATALAVGIWLLRGLPWREVCQPRLDGDLIRAGLKVGGHFMVASVPAVLLSHGDILMLKTLGGVADDQVGIFGFYVQIRGAIVSLCAVSILSFFQPRIVGARQRGDLISYRSEFRRALVVGLTAALLLAVAAAILIYPLVDVLNVPIYLERLDAYWAMLAMPAVYYISSLLTMRLYAAFRDRVIVLASWASLVVNILANLLLIPKLGLLGAALGTLMGLAASIGLSLSWKRSD
jgi:O-antigen/teichoic acid export membrane protein